LDVPFPFPLLFFLFLFVLLPLFTLHRLVRSAPFIFGYGTPVSALEAFIGASLAIALFLRTGGEHPFSILGSIGIDGSRAIVIGFANVIEDPLLLPGDVWRVRVDYIKGPFTF
jgi:hypothetical protein